MTGVPRPACVHGNGHRPSHSRHGGKNRQQTQIQKRNRKRRKRGDGPASVNLDTDSQGSIQAGGQVACCKTAVQRTNGSNPLSLAALEGLVLLRKHGKDPWHAVEGVVPHVVIPGNGRQSADEYGWSMGLGSQTCSDGPISLTVCMLDG